MGKIFVKCKLATHAFYLPFLPMEFTVTNKEESSPIQVQRRRIFFKRRHDDDGPSCPQQFPDETAEVWDKNGFSFGALKKAGAALDAQQASRRSV